MNDQPAYPFHTVWLQRAFGIVIASGSFLAASIAYFELIFILDYNFWDAIRQTSVWLSLFFVPAAALTALFIGSTAQWAQIVFCFVAGIASAFTSGLADLTSLIFVGLGYSLALRYNKIRGHVWLFFVPATGLYLSVWVLSNIRFIDGPVMQILLSAVGGGMLLLLTISIVRSAEMEQQQQQDHLEEMVRDRTSDLEEALHRQEQLRHHNELLLKELHHRTKNNLQIVASLLSIQRSRTDNARKQATAVLEQAEQRIQTLAATHEVFHQTDRLSSVELSEYIRTILASFSHSKGAIEPHFAAPRNGLDVHIGMDQAVLIGLILNEVVTNIVEHAYPGIMVKEVWINFRATDDALVIELMDKGVGVPPEISLERPKTAGMEVVNALVEQLEGTIRLIRTPHTVFHLELPFTPVSE